MCACRSVVASNLVFEKDYTWLLLGLEETRFNNKTLTIELVLGLLIIEARTSHL